MSSQKFIDIEQDGAVLCVILNRPEVLNSFNRAMSHALIDVLTRARDDAAIRAILLTGNGRAFCTGQDLSEVMPKDGEVPALGPIVRDCYNPIISLIRTIEKPVVCAVNGVAAGAGANLAFACDIVFAAEEASFIQSFSKVGLIPDSGGTFMLPRLVGIARATWMTFLGDKLSAQEAQIHGLIYKALPSAQLMDEAKGTAKKLSEMATKGLGLTKRALNRSFTNTLDEQLLLEEALQHEAGLSEDYAEGVGAFLEKRRASFKGR